MRALRHHPLVAALAAAILLAPLAGCGGKSETELLASAKDHLKADDVKAATVELKAVLQKNPESGEARFLLGKTLLGSGDAQGAVVELSKARDLHYDANPLLPVLVRAQLATGQAKSVVDTYATVNLTDPRAAAELKAAVGEAYASLGQTDRCQEAVSQALQLDPKNVAARLLQARLTGVRGQFDAALAIVDGVIAEAPKQVQAWILKGDLLAAGKHDFEAGSAAYRQALAVDPHQLRAHVALIQLQLARRDLEGFKQQVGDLRKAAPESFEALFYGTQLALFDNDLKKAQEGSQLLLRQAPRFGPVLQLAGAIELQSGDVPIAQKHLGQVLQLTPEAPVARRLLAQAYLRSGEAGRALAALKPLLERDRPAADVLALAAEAHLQDGDVASAETYYGLAAKGDPADIKVQVALALMQVAKGSVDTGLAQLEGIAAADKSSYADLALASALVRRNDLPAALKAIDRLQTKLPNKPLPGLLRGRVLLLNQDAVGARASFEKALASDPVYFPAIAELAALDVSENKLDDARKRFETLLTRQPDNMRARLAVADLRRRGGAKPEEVEALLVAAVKSNPDEAAPRLALVQHHLSLLHAKEALAVAQDAAAAMPDNVQVLDALGRSQWAAGETQQAVSTYQSIASLARTPEPYLRLADLYTNAKNYTAAIQNLQRAMEVQPKLLVAQQRLVQIALIRRRAGDALQVAHDVQRQRPTEAVGFVMEGEIQADQKAWDPAIGAFKAALERERSTKLAVRLHVLYVLAGRQADADRFASAWLADHARDADFLSHLGWMAYQRKDYGVAEARYRDAMALRPNDAAALNNVASLLAQQGKPGALALAERANQLAPNQAPYLDTLASALAAEKQLPRALELQQKAVAKEPEVPGYRLNLAKLLLQAGNKDQARTELDKLAALGGRFDGQADVAALRAKL